MELKEWGSQKDGKYLAYVTRRMKISLERQRRLQEKKVRCRGNQSESAQAISIDR